MYLKNFCCYFDLRKGAIVFGFMGFILTIPLIIGLFMAFGYRNRIAELGGINANVVNLLTLFGIFFSYAKLMSYIFLIFGSIRKNHLELLPWLSINMFANLIAIFYLVLYICVIIPKNITPLTIGILCGGIIIISILFYLWFCVYSLYKQLRKYIDNELNPDTTLLII